MCEHCIAGDTTFADILVEGEGEIEDEDFWMVVDFMVFHGTYREWGNA